jgi:hypothetical protein
MNKKPGNAVVPIDVEGLLIKANKKCNRLKSELAAAKEENERLKAKYITAHPVNLKDKPQPTYEYYMNGVRYEIFIKPEGDHNVH